MSEHADLLSRLVAIDSVNPDLVPGGGGEREIAGFIARWLKDAGLEVHVEEPVPRRPNVVAVARGSGGGRSLLLNAHMDTVGVVGMRNPHQPRAEGNRLYGRGAYDMKSGLAAIMLAGARAVRANLAGDVIVTCVADEEVASIGTEAVLRRWRADAAIVTEPTELDVCIAHKGFVWVEVETQGRAGHGSRPELGVDAIAKMGPILTGLEALDRRLRSESRHPLLRSGSVHASIISGGQEISSYPALCRLTFERRTIPGETRETVAGEVEGIIAEAAEATAGLEATYHLGLWRDPFEVAEDEPIVSTVRETTRRRLGREPRVYGETFWADSGLIHAAGIPVLLFGPGGAGAHAVEEWADLDQLGASADILAAVVEEFCGEQSDWRTT
jgi:acetylornithine deacetylase